MGMDGLLVPESMTDDLTRLVCRRQKGIRTHNRPLHHVAVATTILLPPPAAQTTARTRLRRPTRA